MLVNGKEITPSVYTLVVYEQEFNSDMLKDLFSGIPEDENASASEVMSQVGWLDCLKCLWAIERTADENTPSFKKWAKAKSELNLMELFAEMMEEITDAYFHSGADQKKK